MGNKEINLLITMSIMRGFTPDIAKEMASMLDKDVYNKV
jgi:hypothetical protein